MLSIAHIVGIEYPQGIAHLFFVEEFPELFAN